MYVYYVARLGRIPSPIYVIVIYNPDASSFVSLLLVFLYSFGFSHIPSSLNLYVIIYTYRFSELLLIACSRAFSRSLLGENDGPFFYFCFPIFSNSFSWPAPSFLSFSGFWPCEGTYKWILDIDKSSQALPINFSSIARIHGLPTKKLLLSVTQKHLDIISFIKLQAFILPTHSLKTSLFHRFWRLKYGLSIDNLDKRK